MSDSTRNPTANVDVSIHKRVGESWVPAYYLTRDGRVFGIAVDHAGVVPIPPEAVSREELSDLIEPELRRIEAAQSIVSRETIADTARAD
ncbi:MAG: hypothetical protein QM811_01985 [Pirellulales bacterium]